MNGAIEGQEESIIPALAAIEDERTLDHREQTLSDSEQTLTDAGLRCCHETVWIDRHTAPRHHPGTPATGRAARLQGASATGCAPTAASRLNAGTNAISVDIDIQPALDPRVSPLGERRAAAESSAITALPVIHATAMSPATVGERARMTDLRISPRPGSTALPSDRPPGTRMLRVGGSQDRRARDERALFERLASGGDARDRDVLIERFLPLARSVALRYRRSGEPLDDLLQVASLGLIKAIDRFDLDRKIRFSTYAVPTILGEIKRYFRDRTWAVHVPRALQELSLRVDRAADDLAENLSRQPSVPEIIAAVGANEENVLEALQAAGAHHALSFDAPAGGADEETATLGDLIGVDEHGFDRAENRATLAALLATATSRDRKVLHMRFEQDMTQSEIGAIIGVSQMQVSRIIRQALGRIRLATGPTSRG